MATQKGDRGFQEITVSNYGDQRGSQRYSEPWTEVFEEPLAEVDEDGDLLPPPHNGELTVGAPYVAPWRSNLVALSQEFNLYFAAYQSRIHITIPRNVKHSIPARSDMVIFLPRSAQSFRVPPAMDGDHPHSINHMIVGYLGTHEILLIACDDGDVVAYYTHLIMRELNEQGPRGMDMSTPECSVSPLLHENVEASAWGLAIHQKSRLVAIGSNLRAVTVFAFGLDNEEQPPKSYEHVARWQFSLFPTRVASLNEESRNNRRQNFRRVLRLGADGHNIPSLTFSSNNNNDEAESILAIDINGTLWFLDIMSDKKWGHPGMHSHHGQGGESWGWGIIVVELGAFLKQAGPEQAYGTCTSLDPSLRSYDENDIVDISSTTRTTYDADPCGTTTAAFRGLELDETDDQQEDDELDKALKITLPQEQLDKSIGSPYEEIKGRRKYVKGAIKLSTSQPALPEGVAVIRTYKQDVELIPGNKSIPRTLCTKIVKQHNAIVPELLIQHERLNMLASIPELSLIIVGSQAGMVALLTLTRNDTFFDNGPAYAFRVDYTLPFCSRLQTGVKPDVPLLGMAVSPVPIHMGEKGKHKHPRRWRLFLHYHDHTIISYELSRDTALSSLIVTS